LDPRFNVDWSNEIHTKFKFLYNTTHPLRDLIAAYCVHTAWYDSCFLHFINQTQDGIGEDGEIIYFQQHAQKRVAVDDRNPGPPLVGRQYPAMTGQTGRPGTAGTAKAFKS
jgi:hypothetical protein